MTKHCANCLCDNIVAQKQEQLRITKINHSAIDARLQSMFFSGNYHNDKDFYAALLECRNIFADKMMALELEIEKLKESNND